MLTRSPPPFAVSAGGASVTGSGTVVFSNANGVSFGLNGSTVTATVSTNYQSTGNYLTTAMASNRGSDFVQATAVFAGTNATGTVASGGVSVSVGNYITTARASTDAVGLDTAQTNVTWTVNSSGISLNAGGYAGTGFTSTTTAGTQIKATHGTDGLSMAVPAYLTVAAGGANFSAGVSTAGNTAGATGVTGTRLVFVGSQNITLSQSTDADGGTISFSGGAGAAGNTGFVSAGGATASLGTVVFSNSNGLAFGVNGQTVTGSYTQSGQAFSADASSTFQTLTFQDSNGVSFSNNAGALRVTHALQFTSNTSAITSNALNTSASRVFNVLAATNNTGGGTASLSSNVSFSNANGATFYTSAGNAVALSYTVPTVTNSSMSVSDAATSGTLARLAFTNLNGVTLSLSTGAGGSHTIVGSHNALTSQSNQNVTAANGGFAFQTLSFSNANNFSFGTSAGSAVTGSYTTPVVSNALQSVGSATGSGTNTSRFAADDHVHAGVFSVGVSTGGNTAGDTRVDVGRFVLAGGNNVTLSQATAAGALNTISIIGGAGGAFSAGVSTGGNTAGDTGVTGTRLVFAGNNNITLSQATDAGGATITISGATVAGQPVNFSAGTTSGNLGSVVFSNSNLVSFGLNGSTVTGSVPGTSSLSATGVFSISTNGATISMGVGPISAYAVGNTTQSSSGTPSLASFSIRGAGGVSVGVSDGSVVVSGAAGGGGTLSLYAASGTFGTSSGTASGTLSIAGAGGVSVAASDSGWVVSADRHATMSMWPYPLPASTAVSTYYSGSTSQGGGGNSTQSGYTFSLYAVPMDLPAAVAFSELRVGFSNTRSGAGTGSVTHLCSVGFYTNNLSTLSLVKGYYGGLGFTQNSVTAQTFRVFTLTTGSNSVAASGGYGGLRSDGTIYSSAGNISANSQMDGTASPVKFMRVDDGVATTLPAGQYYCVLGFASASASVNVFANAGIMQSAALSSVNIPDIGRENSTQTSNYLPAWGAVSTTFTSQSSAATFFPLPSAIDIANITHTNSSGNRFHVPFMRNHT